MAKPSTRFSIFLRTGNKGIVTGLLLLAIKRRQLSFPIFAARVSREARTARSNASTFQRLSCGSRRDLSGRSGEHTPLGCGCRQLAATSRANALPLNLANQPRVLRGCKLYHRVTGLPKNSSATRSRSQLPRRGRVIGKLPTTAR